MIIKKQCKFCEKVFEGYTDKHIEHMYLMHIIAKHKDKIEVKEE